jgi:hypothetical protein
LITRKNQEKGRPSYPVRVHTMRKVFRTNAPTNSNAPESHFVYMMGHVDGDVYNQVRSVGIEKLRSEYAQANLHIGPRTAVQAQTMLKDLARLLGIPPEKVRIEPDTKYLDPGERDRAEILAQLRAIFVEAQKPPTGEFPRDH